MSFDHTKVCTFWVFCFREYSKHYSMLISYFVMMHGRESFPKHPLHSKTGQWHTLNLYIFMIPHQFQINMQDFRPPSWFAYFRWHVFWVRVELLFANKFCLNFWGNVRKIATKCSIIDVDPYMIPHFEANMTHYVFT